MRRSRNSRVGVGAIGLGVLALVALAGCGATSATPGSSANPGGAANAGSSAGPGGAPGAPGSPLACPTAPVVLASQADVARLAGCSATAGITIRSGAALDLAPLRVLTALHGDLVIGPTVAVEDLSLADLRSVDGAIRVVGNGLLRGLYLPQLASAGSIAIDGNPALATLSLPRLAAVHGALQITDDASLELVDVSALTAVDGALVVTGAPGLSLLDADHLQRAARVELDAAKLPPDLVDRLHGCAAAP